MQSLKISNGQRHLCHADGTPFFWLGDTAWELFHKLTYEEAAVYAKNRAELGFNVSQICILAECDGLRGGNAYGRKPLLQNASGDFDPAMPDTDGEHDYWSHVDRVIGLLGAYGIYAAVLPTWGDKFNVRHGIGPEIFDAGNARAYGKWVAERLSHHDNIIWVMGGDRDMDLPRHFDIVRAMAKGVRAGDRKPHLMTLHPAGGISSSVAFHHDDWLDFNMIQTGHGTSQYPMGLLEHDYALCPTKPFVDGEPRYEAHPINFNVANGYFSTFDVRMGCYLALFGGGFGVTYGHHCIWQMNTEPLPYHPFTWNESLDAPAAKQLIHLKNLMLEHDFQHLAPAPNVFSNGSKGYALADEQRILAYVIDGGNISLNTTGIKKERYDVALFEPVSGEKRMFGREKNMGYFDMPVKGLDKVIILEGVDL
ncbi:MAG: glycoside hydrolase family 140 protein [Verrucomicrobiales bacterium]|jgi:hypothetical protein|nr:glycoside hydrolase family 140 protein [Verrucomicrobiales bacterium]